MIKSCENIKTEDEFNIFCDIWYNTYAMGLQETADVMSWDENYIINPESVL